MAKQRTENVPPAALWKDTFSDLMNLLLCFFVLMFAMSNIDSQKFEEITSSRRFCTVKGRNSCKQWGESAE